jgi:hypothetical protein
MINRMYVHVKYILLSKDNHSQDIEICYHYYLLVYIYI